MISKMWPTIGVICCAICTIISISEHNYKEALAWGSATAWALSNLLIRIQYKIED